MDARRNDAFLLTGITGTETLYVSALGLPIYSMQAHGHTVVVTS